METIASKLIKAITKHAVKRINLMEVCGTHTMVIAKSGIRSMLPEIDQTRTLIGGVRGQSPVEQASWRISKRTEPSGDQGIKEIPTNVARSTIPWKRSRVLTSMKTRQGPEANQA